MIRENRTYDQVLGDLEKGNGDPSLCLFGEEVTPNAHALAREFVLLDNFYVDAEVSYDGHAFSTGAYATDFVEKVWPMNYGRRGGRYLSEGGGAMRNPYGNITAPAQRLHLGRRHARGRQRAQLRRVRRPRTKTDDARRAASGEVRALVPGLEGQVHPTYPPYDLSDSGQPAHRRLARGVPAVRDRRAAAAACPSSGWATTTPRARARGYPTPRAMVAENDLALGPPGRGDHRRAATGRSRRSSSSRTTRRTGPTTWTRTARRRFVISPYTRRGAVDSTLYTTSGMLRTIELILGLPPMSQYDAAATPMYNAFQTAPVLTPFTKRDRRACRSTR